MHFHYAVLHNEFSPDDKSLKIDGLIIEESTHWTEQTMPVRR